ncbi:hypothetical protein [Gordonia sp. KTR9]|uniref:hypothetical protein n=1 Tax=Gordonia sp. KTR9 TaxID=337191 RepID=UPI0005C7F85C|nr:hypothetical protein [Gordonia sp. KTR9]
MSDTLASAAAVLQRPFVERLTGECDGSLDGDLLGALVLFAAVDVGELDGDVHWLSTSICAGGSWRYYRRGGRDRGCAQALLAGRRGPASQLDWVVARVENLDEPVDQLALAHA